MRRPPTVASKRRRNARDRARVEQLRIENGGVAPASPLAARVAKQAERVEWALGRIDAAREVWIANPNDRALALAFSARRDEWQNAKYVLAMLTGSA